MNKSTGELKRLSEVRARKPSRSWDTYITLFLVLVGILAFMPVFATFDDLLTRIVINFKGYYFIREVVVPFEIKLVAMVLTLLRLPVSANNEYIVIGKSQPFFSEIVWNCIGWQSLLFFIITIAVALQGNQYTFISKCKVVLMGMIGTVLVNILRMSAIIITAYTLGPFFGRIIHDYASNLLLIGWLFVFWWFAFNFVLENRRANN